MKKHIKNIIIVVLMLVTVLSLVACGKKGTYKDPVPDNAIILVDGEGEEENYGYTDYESLADAVKASGTDLQVPEVEGYKTVRFSTKGTSIDATYESDGNMFIIRKAPSKSFMDIAGTDEEFASEQFVSVNNQSVTVHGSADDKATEAVWYKDGYSHALVMRDEMSFVDFSHLLTLFVD